MAEDGVLGDAAVCQAMEQFHVVDALAEVSRLTEQVLVDMDDGLVGAEILGGLDLDHGLEQQFQAAGQGVLRQRNHGARLQHNVACLDLIAVLVEYGAVEWVRHRSREFLNGSRGEVGVVVVQGHHVLRPGYLVEVAVHGLEW
ncbi:hypothetical protein NG825_05885 [Xanthomonas sacchari]|nr:hypothetical protein NG825_05885 [Xanthomonas sacchari]